MRWRYTLVNSKDLSRVGELTQARQRKCDIILDKPGSGSFTYPMSAIYADAIQPYSAGVIAERFNWRATVAHRLAGNRGSVWDPIWSGYVGPISEDWTNDTMQVTLYGWMKRFEKRMLRRDKTYSDTDDGDIMIDMVNEMNLSPAPDSYPVPIVAGSNPNTPTWVTTVGGGRTPNEGPGGATAYEVQTRNYNKQKYTKVGPILDELVNIENGADWSLDPLSRIFTVHRRYMRNLPNVVVALRWGPSNLQQFSRELGFDEMVNYFLTTGGAMSIPQYAHNVSQQLAVGLLEETAAFSDVNDNGVLLANSGAEIIVRQNGHITYGVTPFPYTAGMKQQDSNVPEPFVDYRVGDQIRVTAKHPKRGDILNQAIRVFGMNVTIDDNGNEILGQLQVAP